MTTCRAAGRGCACRGARPAEDAHPQPRLPHRSAVLHLLLVGPHLRRRAACSCCAGAAAPGHPTPAVKVTTKTCGNVGGGGVDGVGPLGTLHPDIKVEKKIFRQIFVFLGTGQPPNTLDLSHPPAHLPTHPPAIPPRRPAAVRRRRHHHRPVAGRQPVLGVREPGGAPAAAAAAAAGGGRRRRGGAVAAAGGGGGKRGRGVRCGVVRRPCFSPACSILRPCLCQACQHAHRQSVGRGIRGTDGRRCPHRRCKGPAPARALSRASLRSLYHAYHVPWSVQQR